MLPRLVDLLRSHPIVVRRRLATPHPSRSVSVAKAAAAAHGDDATPNPTIVRSRFCSRQLRRRRRSKARRSGQRRQENGLPGARRGRPTLRLRRSDHSRVGRAVDRPGPRRRDISVDRIPARTARRWPRRRAPPPGSCPRRRRRRSCAVRPGPRRAKRPDPSPAVRRCRARAGFSPPLREAGRPRRRAGRRGLSSADAAGETSATRRRFRSSAPPAPRPDDEGSSSAIEAGASSSRPSRDSLRRRSALAVAAASAERAFASCRSRPEIGSAEAASPLARRKRALLGLEGLDFRVRFGDLVPRGPRPSATAVRRRRARFRPFAPSLSRHRFPPPRRRRGPRESDRARRIRSASPSSPALGTRSAATGTRRPSAGSLAGEFSVCRKAKPVDRLARQIRVPRGLETPSVGFAALRLLGYGRIAGWFLEQDLGDADVARAERAATYTPRRRRARRASPGPPIGPAAGIARRDRCPGSIGSRVDFCLFVDHPLRSSTQRSASNLDQHGFRHVKAGRASAVR